MSSVWSTLETSCGGRVFEPLGDPTVFAQVRVDPELGAIVWPNGADLDPCALHDIIASSPTRSTG